MFVNFVYALELSTRTYAIHMYMYAMYIADLGSKWGERELT